MPFVILSTDRRELYGVFSNFHRARESLIRAPPTAEVRYILPGRSISTCTRQTHLDPEEEMNVQTWYVSRTPTDLQLHSDLASARAVSDQVWKVPINQILSEKSLLSISAWKV